jgi:asparagine synthase (glutamine-hydrolysing)
VCGIAGVVSDGPPVRREDVARMADRQAHRGPDGSGVWMSADGRAGLSHRRLAILDLSPAGAQPCSDDEKDVHLVYNGEVYNFRDLRAELERAGWRFRSRSDAEVVLRGYQEWGDSVVERLRGMFAFGIWDGPRQRLFLARDRLGIKPLHWAESDGVFVFASELKGVEAGPIADRSLDVSALWDFLTYGWVPAPKTPWRSMRKLPAAHVLVREAGRTTVRRWWSPGFEASGARDRRRLEAELLERLEEAVRLHLLSDVPVGALLSGGIDSSAVTAFAARAGAGLRTYSVGFEEAAVSEAPFARRVAELFGTEHVEETSRLEDARAAFDGLAGWMDEPFGDTSIVPTALVCEVARRGVKVALSGDGGDELFAGYRRYAKFVRQRRRDVLPRAVRVGIAPHLARRLPPASPGRRSLLRWGMDDPARHVFLNGGMTRQEKEDALPEAIVARFAGYDDCWAIRSHWREDLDPWSRQQYVDLMTYLPDDLLTKVDRASMRVGLEVRPPLLDHRLVEWAAGVPAAVRVRGGRLKSLLRSALHGVLPPEILDRKKQGFSIPTERWVRDGLLRDTEPSGWYLPHRVAWSLLARWTGPRLGVGDPSEILREGP